MKAKDTVVPVEKHSQSIWCPHCGEEFGIESKVEYERELQAEISFKTGYEQGVDDTITLCPLLREETKKEKYGTNT